MFSKVLVPLGGSELAEGILPFVAQFARGFGCPLVLLSVIDPKSIDVPNQTRATSPRSSQGVTSPPSVSAGEIPSTAADTLRVRAASKPAPVGGPYASQVFDRLEAEARTRLAEVAAKLTNEGLTVDTVVVFDSPAETIVSTAEREGCDLIAMSTRGRSALARGILGSVTDKVIHSSSLPTLTISPNRAESYWRQGASISSVMVPLDGSELAETSLPRVEKLALALSLQVVLVRVIKLGGVYSAYSDANPYALPNELEEEMESSAKDYLDTVAERLRAKGLRVRCELTKGTPAASIVDLAKESPNNLIVMATHGRSGITRWVLGSVAEAVIRSSGDPVLVIPPP